MSEDTTAQLPGQATFDGLPKPPDRAAIDAALRGETSNGAKPAAAPARGPGGQFVKKTAAPRPGVDTHELAQATAPEPAAAAEAPCEDCPPAGVDTARDMAPVLGWLILGAATVLLYIGGDLVSRGRLSGRLGGARWDDDQ